jgi:hypothetical protein
MKTYLWIMALAMIGLAPLPGQAADSGGDAWREVVCYTKDSRNIEYSARGFKGNLSRVKRRALNVCRRYSERPSTCRLLRCRP